VSGAARERLNFTDTRFSSPLRATLQLVLSMTCIGVLAAFEASLFVYKIWYIAAVIAFAVVAALSLIGLVRIDGLAFGAAPILLYFGYLALTSLWALFPSITLTWVLIDSIEVVVFALFYLWSLNASPRHISNGLVLLAYLSLPIALVLYLIDPTEIRLGERGLAVLPALIPFCWMIAVRQRSLWGLGGVFVVLGMLIVSQSRAPVGAGLIAAWLCGIAYSKNTRQWLFATLLLFATFAVIVAVLLWNSASRDLVIGALSRFAVSDIDIAGITIEAEPHDEVRWLLFFVALDTIWTYQPFGMGYMNFYQWFGQEIGDAQNLHMSAQTWLLEGGVLCVAIVAIMFLRFYQVLSRTKRKGLKELKDYCTALSIAMAAILILSLFHQPHQAPMMYALLGLGYSLARIGQRARYLLPVPVAPRTTTTPAIS
jgi:hypothetical protein